jgi:hypothetical protein
MSSEFANKSIKASRKKCDFFLHGRKKCDLSHPTYITTGNKESAFF